MRKLRISVLPPFLVFTAETLQFALIVAVFRNILGMEFSPVCPVRRMPCAKARVPVSSLVLFASTAETAQNVPVRLFQQTGSQTIRGAVCLRTPRNQSERSRAKPPRARFRDGCVPRREPISEREADGCAEENRRIRTRIPVRLRSREPSFFPAAVFFFHPGFAIIGTDAQATA